MRSHAPSRRAEPTNLGPRCWRASPRLPDQRTRRGVHDPLAILLTIAVLAKLCGSSQVRAIADWAHERRTALHAAVQRNRAKMPHPTTWTRVPGMGVAANAIDAAVQPLLVPAASADVPTRASRQVAVDGTTMRGTCPAGASHGVHLVSGYDVRQRVVLAAKANEIAAAPALLAALPLRGVLVTGDAMDARRQRSVRIVEAGGDSCWMVREHQKGNTRRGCTTTCDCWLRRSRTNCRGRARSLTTS